MFNLKAVSLKIPQILLTQVKVGQQSVKAILLRFPFYFSFGFLTVLNLWFALHDRTTPYFNGVTAVANPLQAAKAWGWSDSGSYLQMGIAQAKFGHLPPDLMWTAIFWPPGMGYLNAFAIKMVGLEGQFIFVLATITALLWGLVMALIFNILRIFMRFWIAILVMVAVIQTDLYHQYLVRDAIIWSDGYAAGFICLTILFSYKGYSNSNIKYFALSGFSLAALAYVRGQYFVVIQFFLVLAVGFLGLALVLFLYNRARMLPSFLKKTGSFSRKVSAPLALLSLVAILTCAPYLLWQKNHVGDISWDLKGEWHWTSTDAFAAMGNWIKAEDQAGFIAQGGGGTACKVDPELCEMVYLAEYRDKTPFSIYDSEPYTGEEFYAMTLKTFRQHPVQWFKIKFPYLVKYWNSTPAISGPSQSDLNASVVSAAGLAILAVSLLFKRSRLIWFAPAIITVTLIGATVGPAYLAHLEVRYLASVKLIGLVISLGTVGYWVNCLIQSGIRKKSLQLREHLVGSPSTDRTYLVNNDN